MRSPKALVPGIALGLAATALAALPSTSAHAASAANTLVVNAQANLRPVTHVASGALYGLAYNGTPAASLVDPLHPSSFVQMAPGGTQRPGGDALVVAPEAAAAGAKVIVRMPDWYPNFPYGWVSWSDWLAAVDKQIASVKASGAANIGAYELWNEPDWTWNTSAAGDFNAGWVRTYREVRGKDATTPIDGPSYSYYNATSMSSFLSYAKANNALPDIVSWHELGGDTNIGADVASYRALESSLGISPRPIIIEEYASRTEVGVPGALVGYIAKFERAGVTYADLPFWNDYGTLGDLLVSRGGSPNAAWWLYDWYGSMTGEMVSTVPPAQTGIDGAASVNAARNQVSIIVGGGSGDAAVTVNGLSSLSGFGSSAHAVLEHVVSQGRTTPATAPQSMSAADYPINGGSITVPIPAMNASDGYRIIVTPTAGSTGNTVTVTNPGAHTGAVGTAITPVQVQATDSAPAQTLTYSAAGLPPGLSINSTGLISGTPTAAGSYSTTVTAADSTGASGSATFTWTVSGGTTGGGTCQVSYVKNEWTGGFTANLTITDTGTNAVNGWTLKFAFPGDQKVTSAWNATVTQSGSTVTAMNVSYNGTIAPGRNVQFGFQGTWTSSDASPTAFTLNGTACG